MNALLERAMKTHVGQWSLAYLAGGWFLLQLMDVVGSRWGLSPGAERALDVLLVGGFFITLVVAWYHGERGQQRVSGPELLLIAALLASTAAALPLVAGSEMPVEEEAAYSRDRPTIAVLPLRSIGDGDPYFAEGLHEELVYQLSKLRGVDAISRTSTLQFTERPPSMRAVALELGATAIAEGSVRIAGDQVRITIQLIDGQTDVELFSEEFNRELTTENLLEIQVEIAQSIAEELNAPSAPVEIASGVGRPTQNYEAYRFYLQGRALWTRENVKPLREQAIQALQRAVEEDPDFGLAWVALAEILMNDFATYGNAASGAPAAAAVARAKEAAGGTIEVQHLDARWAYLVAADYDRGRALMDDLLHKAPGLAGLLRDLALLESRRGHFETGLEFLERELSIDPASFYGHFLHGLFLTSVGRYQDADLAWQRAIAIDPTNVEVYSRRVINYIAWRGLEASQELISSFAPEVQRQIARYPAWGYPPPSPAYFRRDYASLVAAMPPDAGNIRNRGIAARLARNQAVATQAADSLRVRWEAVLDELAQSDGPRLRSLEALAHAQLAIAAALMGDTATVQAETSLSSRLAPTSLDAPRSSRWHYVCAQALAMVGEAQRAMDFLEAYAALPWGIPPEVVRADPVFDPLRQYPQFMAFGELPTPAG